jgi:hypothetical protein
MPMSYRLCSPPKTPAEVTSSVKFSGLPAAGIMRLRQWSITNQGNPEISTLELLPANGTMTMIPSPAF